ncbi:very low-density lipoprotein receptor-like isoform X2 [Ylistrum balloti]|uniref:very low-density lipoprotein receptor-like isoform X2 n=1 Tax=Ylistrum balloti TaxID=509963 RepID=UPI002905AD32|nr:very low-density lipoprotein receptor-like isoform X2 [Ylistrum balloti]
MSGIFRTTAISSVLMTAFTLFCLCQTAHIKKIKRSVSCERSEFACNSGCIPNGWACDGDPDCSGGEDEFPSLCDNRVCPDTYFKCDVNKCFPCENVNDGFPDCFDSFDEENNNVACTMPPPTT